MTVTVTVAILAARRADARRVSIVSMRLIAKVPAKECSNFVSVMFHYPLSLSLVSH